MESSKQGLCMLNLFSMYEFQKDLLFPSNKPEKKVIQFLNWLAKCLVLVILPRCHLLENGKDIKYKKKCHSFCFLFMRLISILYSTYKGTEYEAHTTRHNAITFYLIKFLNYIDNAMSHPYLHGHSSEVISHCF